MALRINIPSLTRGLLGGLLFFSLLSATAHYNGHDSATAYLSIHPESAVYSPWTFVTAVFVERSILTLLVAAINIFYFGRYLERAWGSTEFGKFVALVAVVPNVLTFLLAIVWRTLFGAYTSFSVIDGGIALQIAFLVAFKQLLPEHTVTFARGFASLKVKVFPAIFLLVATVFGLVFGTLVSATLTWVGFYTSWIYLRFYKKSHADLSSSQPSTLRGDASSSFAIKNFFPEQIQPPIAAVANTVYLTAVSTKLISPFSEADIAASNSHAQSRDGGGMHQARPGAQPGTARAEAERRRALALKALDQRLNAATNKAQSAGQAAIAEGPSVLGETTYNPETNEEGEGSKS